MIIDILLWYVMVYYYIHIYYVMLCYCYIMLYYVMLYILYNVILYYAIHQVLYYTWSVEVDPPRFALAVGQSLRASRRKCRPLVALVALGAPLK
jgi:membrane protein YdbS with pleckstrin-like domain